MKVLILLSSIFVFANQNVNAQVTVSADQIWADQQCGGNAAYKKDESKFNACVEAKLKSRKSSSPMEVSADQIWADQQCGGNAAYKKDENKFNACVEAKLKSKKSSSPMEVSADQIWIDQQCGGNAAFKKDEKKFNACVEAKTKSKESTGNSGSCKDFADSFLDKRGLGKIGRPSSKVRESNFNKDKVTGLPEISLKTSNGDRISSKAVDKVDKSLWTLTVESGWQVPMFESPSATISNIYKGSYTRTYNFETVGGACVLRSIDSSFLPDGKNETVRKSETLSQADCKTFAHSYSEEQEQVGRGKYAKLLAEDSMKGYVCTEALALFNEPQNMKDKIILHEDVRSTR